MSKKLYAPVVLILLLSMLLTACGGAATTVAPVATDIPVATEVPTQVPTEVPTPEPTPEPALDYQALFSSLIAELTPDKGYGTVGAAKLNEELVEGNVLLLDVREASELEKDGYIEGAINIPVREVMKNLDKLFGLDDPVVVYCASGHRGAFVMAALKLMGYTNVRNLAGGIGAWKKANLPVITGSTPPPAEPGTAPAIANQALFTALDEFFTSLPEGFFATSAAKVNETLTSGNAPTLVDIRRVEEVNKTGYIEGSINVPLEELLASLDKLPAKDAPMIIYCVSGHRAGVATMALRFLGYTNIINMGGGFNAWKAGQFAVTYNWNFLWDNLLTNLPDGFYSISAADLNAKLAEAAPFILDIREASEIADTGFITGAVHIPFREVLKNLDKLPAIDQPIVIYCASGHRGGLLLAALKLLGYKDVLNLGGGIGAWKKAELPLETGDPALPVAGTTPVVDSALLAQLDAYFTGLPAGFSTVKPADLNVELADKAPFLLDIREASELTNEGYIEGAVNIPVRTVMASLDKLPAKDQPIVVICKSGHRASMVMMALQFLGYTNARNLAGGMNAWIAAELPVVK